MAETRLPFQVWLEAEGGAGPQKSYRLACRLLEQMRPLGRTAAARANWALAHTLFWRGRFEESRTLLIATRFDTLEPDAASHSHPLALLIPAQLSWALALLGETGQSHQYAEDALAWTRLQTDPCHLPVVGSYLSLLHCFLDEPVASLEWSRRVQAAASKKTQTRLIDTAKLLEYWALCRLGQATHEANAQAALARLRHLGRAQEARAFSLYAQGLFHQAPAYACTQLDAALDMNARCGLHHWEARLLHLKAQSLDAAGLLAEASRFYQLAQETAQHQGARLFLDKMAPIESFTDPTLYP